MIDSGVTSGAMKGEITLFRRSGEATGNYVIKRNTHTVGLTPKPAATFYDAFTVKGSARLLRFESSRGL